MGHLPSFLVPTLGDLTPQEYPPQGICHLPFEFVKNELICTQDFEAVQKAGSRVSSGLKPRLFRPDNTLLLVF